MNFGLRLNELLNSGDGILHCCGDYQDEAKQAITSLIKELVADAKPYGKRQFRELIEDAWYEAPTAAAGFGRIEAIHNQFEQNLLKGLEALE